MPVSTKKEKAIFLKASRSFQLIVKSIQTLRAYLSEDHLTRSPDYYLARNLLRDAETLYWEAVAEARKLLGPLPGYISSQDADSKKAILEALGVVAKSEDMANLQSELERDEFIASMFEPDEIALYIRANFESQSKGKRKLPNIKARMALDKIQGEIAEARELRERAQQKHKALSSSA